MYQPNLFDPNGDLLDFTEHETVQNENALVLVEPEPVLQNENALVPVEDESVPEITGPPAGDDRDPNPRPRKKQYHRHTQHQTEEMEAFFKECPHPDDSQRRELSRRLGLEPLQVKFWFQNKRTQMKTQQERIDNSQMRQENNQLCADNIRFKEALSNSTCPECGGPVQFKQVSDEEKQLRLENARLHEQRKACESAINGSGFGGLKRIMEMDRMTGLPLGTGQSLMSYPPLAFPPAMRPLNLGVGNFGLQGGMAGGDRFGSSTLLRSVSGSSDSNNSIIGEIAVAAMDELLKLAWAGEPLWVPNADNTFEVLNEEEYLLVFPYAVGSKPVGLRTEASRDSAIVMMNQDNLVEMLMDANQWCSMFCTVVSRATTVEVLSTGIDGKYNGALQMMSAELQIGSPYVKSREINFMRYCKQQSDGTWAIVDASFDNLMSSAGSKCKRRPSGCLIQGLPDGFSKVTWIEHVQINDGAVHSIYKDLINSGLGFGAKRWVATLGRQCERLASFMASSLSPGDLGVVSSLEGRKSTLQLAQRMVMSFCSGIGGSTSHTWTTLSGSRTDDIRVMTRKSMDDPGRPPGIVLSAATSFWLPVQQKQIFNFLRDESTRSEWDILSNSGLVQEMGHIALGLNPGNSVSLLRVDSANSSQGGNMLILQESFTDETGSYIIYAPVDIVSMNVVLGGGDPTYVPLLPSGFSILPDGPKMNVEGCGTSEVGLGGSLLTVAFQILVDSGQGTLLSLGSVSTVSSLIKSTVDRIRCAVIGNALN